MLMLSWAVNIWSAWIGAQGDQWTNVKAAVIRQAAIRNSDISLSLFTIVRRLNIDFDIADEVKVNVQKPESRSLSSIRLRSAQECHQRGANSRCVTPACDTPSNDSQRPEIGHPRAILSAVSFYGAIRARQP